MFVNNQKGLTLIELLAAITISFLVIGLVTSVLLQSYRSLEINNSHISLRQEANIMINALTSAQQNPTCITDQNDNRICQYTIQLNSTSIGQAELKIGSHSFYNNDYDFFLEILVLDVDTPPKIFDSKNPNALEELDPKWTIHIKTLRLTDKNNPNLQYEISTILNRL